tara:strand:+ start:638 stop:886 length:249 start_codon:yes stop_codon:yes gene_type:complete
VINQGQLYKVTKKTKNTSFSSLRPAKDDTILVLNVGVYEDPFGTSRPWREVETLICGKLHHFKLWEFNDLIDTSSIKLVKID